MKKTALCLLIILSIISLKGFTQSVNFNINMSPPTIAVGQTGRIEVNICNIDTRPISVPANKLRPLISVNGNVTITGVTDMNGNPLTGFTVQSLSSGSGNSIRLLANEPLPNFECFDFYVIVEGVKVGETDVITGTLGFQGPPPVNDNPSDNNSTTGVAVTAPLPVTLASFITLKESTTTFIKWSTTSETNSGHFEVQRSNNGRNWIKLGEVSSTGESSTLQNYTFSDPNPSNGENLYRLKMVDLDGTFAYSSIRNINFDNTLQAYVFPNPVSDRLLIKNYEGVKSVALHNLNGAKVLEIAKVSSTGIDIKHLQPGMYLISITMPDGTLNTHKVAISR